jgi:5-methylcytosine-specific restriction endonuclease McrA
MISIHLSPIRKLIKLNFQSDISTYADSLKDDMLHMLNHKDAQLPWQQDYIMEIIALHQKLILASPSDIETYIKRFDKIHPAKKVKLKTNIKFREALLSAMGYSARRKDFYPTYFQKIGIRTCVYCNSQFALSVEADNFDKKRKRTTKVEAKFQVDHFMSKSQYPCFSISLFNLYPVCATCNNIKSTLEVNFSLYNEDDKKANTSRYVFSLEPGCVATYLSNGFKADSLKLIFTDPDKPHNEKFGDRSISDTFDIKGIYDTQIDIIEELVQKRRIYNTSYREILVKSFPDLFNHSSLSERTLLGNYHLPDDIHKRPMAKFMQDIDSHLKGLIDPDTGLAY